MFFVAKVLLRVAAAAAVLAVFAPLSALAQNPPGLGTLDHYKVYTWQSPLFELPTVGLRDQFMSGSYQLRGPTFLSPPAQKNEEPVHDPRIHLQWYELLNPLPEPSRRVVVNNQFGESFLDVGQSRYLLVPTVKNEEQVPFPFPPLPLSHYKCYDAVGPYVVRTVTLVTQFGTELVQVAKPRYLCNPVEKIHNGIVSPILNETDHLVCYDIFPPVPLNVTVSTQDQFGVRGGVVFENRWLCVPSLKEIPTGTEATTWSRVRALYR
jgi:hypothetical protein